MSLGWVGFVPVTIVLCEGSENVYVFCVHWFFFRSLRMAGKGLRPRAEQTKEDKKNNKKKKKKTKKNKKTTTKKKLKRKMMRRKKQKKTFKEEEENKIEER